MKQTIRISVAAERFSVSKRVLLRLVETGDIDAWRPGKETLLDMAQTEAWYESKKVRPARKIQKRRRT